MATTAVLHSSDMHRATDQSPAVTEAAFFQNMINSPLIHRYSPNQLASYGNGLMADGSFQMHHQRQRQSHFAVQQPSRNMYQSLTPEPAPSCMLESTSYIELGVSQHHRTLVSQVPDVHSPFHEVSLRKRPINFQQPPQFLNTGNPLHSGVQLELPRHARIVYPDASYECTNALNKLINAVSINNGTFLQPSVPPNSGPPMHRNLAVANAFPGHMMNGYRASYPGPSVSQTGMYSLPPHIRHMANQKFPMQQNAPAQYQYCSPSSVGLQKKQTTNGKRPKAQSSKNSDDKAVRKGELCSQSAPGGFDPSSAEAARPSMNGTNQNCIHPMMAYNGMNMVEGPSQMQGSFVPNSQMLQPGIRHGYSFEANNMPFEVSQSMGNSNGDMVQMHVMRPNAHGNTPAKNEVGSIVMSKPMVMNSNVYEAQMPIKSPYQMPLNAPNGSVEMYPMRNVNGCTSPNIPQCATCNDSIRADRPGIQCTGNGLGCRRFFHQECTTLVPEAFRMLLTEPNVCWVCDECAVRVGLE